MKRTLPGVSSGELAAEYRRGLSGGSSSSTRSTETAHDGQNFSSARMPSPRASSRSMYAADPCRLQMYDRYRCSAVLTAYSARARMFAFVSAARMSQSAVGHSRRVVAPTTSSGTAAYFFLWCWGRSSAPPTC